MKRLLLMRHAKSSWKETELPDHDRPLKGKGEKNAEAMGKFLKSKELVPDVIIASSALRAVKTAELVAQKSGFKGDVVKLDALYMAEPSVWLDALRAHADHQKVVLLVGHNPGMEALLQLLTGKVESLQTACVAYLAVDIKSWKELNEKTEFELKKLWHPKDA